MKFADPTALDRRYAAAQRVSWLLELSQGDWTWRGATLATALGGEDYPARLGELLRWREWLPDSGSEGGRARAEAELRIPDQPWAEDSLRAELETRAPVGIAAILRLAWLDPEGIEAASAATMLRGRLTDWSVGGNGATIRLNDELEAIGGRRIGRLLRKGMLAGGADSTAIGGPLPWIFGALADAELVPLRVGATTRLASEIDAAETSIPVVSLEGFPFSGLVQIGSEKIYYGAIEQLGDGPGGTLGTSLIPAVRGSGATAHRAGETVRVVPTGEFLFLAADHPCKSVAAVFADGMPLAESAWSAIPLTLGGRTVQGVWMQAWPVDADDRPARRFSAKVVGLADEDGSLIENPARAIEALLTHERLGNLASDRIDAAEIDTIAILLNARGYRFARRVSGNKTLGELLDGAAEEAGLWIQATDPIRLVLADPVPHAESVAEDLDATRMLFPPAPSHVAAPAGFLPADAVELIGAAAAAGKPRLAFLFPPERQVDGTIPRRFAIHWLDLGAGSAAGDLGELRWRRSGEAPFVHEQPYPLGTALLSCGDTVRLTDGPLDMDETLGWVRRIEAGAPVGGPARSRVEAWGPWAGAYLWKSDRLNHIRRFAFGGHLLIVLAGKPVALLTREGTLRIAGRLRERASLGGGTQGAAIVLSGEWLTFGAGSAGVFAPFLRIGGGGDAELTGTLRERSALAIESGGNAYGAEANRFWFAPDARTGAMEWRADAAVLHLPGILIERVRL